MADARDAYRQRCAALQAALRAAGAGAPLGLAKARSNLFRDRAPRAKQHVDLSAFDHVLCVDGQAGWVDVEGLTPYDALVDATLAAGVMPAVVPELKSITVGGAVAGVGIEATSFRHGLVHHTVLELDVLLPDGSIVLCTPDNAHRELFYGFPNSYGTLGYALRVRLRTLPVRRYVQVDHRVDDDPARFLAGLDDDEARGADFVEGVVFGPRSHVRSLGRFVDDAPFTSDYTFQHIYYRSLLERSTDYLTVRDFLWRWDTDWFWCSRNIGAHHPLVRRLLGRGRLNSRFYTSVMRFNARWGVTRALARLSGRHPESVIQDVDIPFAQGGPFLAFLVHNIGILPIWVCPIGVPAEAGEFPLYPLHRAERYLNFGFWDVIDDSPDPVGGHFNRRIEQEVLNAHGLKSLYSDSWFTPEEFARAYDLRGYERLKARYDPDGRMLSLYEKCVLRA